MQEHSLTPASLAAHRTAAQTPEKTQQRNLRSALRSAVSRVNRRTTAISPDNVSDTKVGIETSEVVKKKGKTAVRFSQLLSRKDEPNESNLMDTNTTGTSAKTISLRNEPRTNTLLRKVVNNLRSTKAKRRWKLALQPETDITDQYLLK
jgi:hypothetical protein